MRDFFGGRPGLRATTGPVPEEALSTNEKAASENLRHHFIRQAIIVSINEHTATFILIAHGLGPRHHPIQENDSSVDSLR